MQAKKEQLAEEAAHGHSHSHAHGIIAEEDEPE
jgi:hypothetical protein